MKTAYLTIDDVPSRYFGEKLDFLKKNGIPAILFCGGKDSVDNEKLLINALKSGYILGNHSYSHPHFSDLPEKECFQEIQKTDLILSKLYESAGIGWDKKYFRFPYFDRGGNADSSDYENRRPVKEPDKIIKIQDFLKTLGYIKPDFKNITYKYYHENSPSYLIDAICTFDQSEYLFRSKDAPYGLGEESAILNRIEENFPEEGRGLNYQGSYDIILIHDHDYTNDLFFKCINRYLEKKINLILP